MKKRILSAILLSAVTLSAASPVTIALADNYSSKIAAKEATIKNLTAEQAAAQAKVVSIRKQVSDLEAKQADLEAETAKLEKESATLTKEIEVLSSNIVARHDALKEQARSAQQHNMTTSYINVLMNSDSLSDAISRVMAVNEVVSANTKMLKQQEEDKKAIEVKQTENQKAINTVWENQQKLAETSASLNTQKAELEVAQLNLASQLATAESEKSALIAQKTAAEAAAQKAAAAQAAQQAEANKLVATQVKSVSEAKAAVAAALGTSTSTSSETSVLAKTSSTVASSTGNNYPIGECTWGAKQMAAWAGSNWGNASQWPAAAAAAGFRTGTTPQVGAIVSWSGGAYGHVAYVTGVDASGNIQVMESNYAGNRYLSNNRGFFNPIGIQGAVTYFYPN